jgi:hypothetical protein
MLLLLLALVGRPGAARALANCSAADTAPNSIVCNGSFEDLGGQTLQFGSWGLFSTIPGWTAEAVGACTPYIEIDTAPALEGLVPANGTHSVELNANCPSGLYQDLPTVPGNQYTLRFAFAARPGFPQASNNMLKITWNGAVVDTITTTTPAYTYHTYQVTATGTTTRLHVDSGSSGSTGVGGEVDDVSVVDATPPVLTLPSNSTHEATGPTGAVVTFTASATDLVDGSVPVTCTPASGSTFPLGTTTVNCSATDKAGNKATGSFTVTVVDTTPPTLTLPSNSTTTATSPAGAVVTFTASATDLVDGSDPVTCAPASGSTFPLGTTTVNCSATDKAGNKVAGSFTVTVGFQVCVLYDQTKAAQSGSTIPIKLYLCDASGNDISASSIVVTATGVTQTSTSAPGALEDAGNANPDNNFRYDSTLGPSGGYIYNLSTKGLGTGTYTLSFTVGSDPATHTVQFQVR